MEGESVDVMSLNLTPINVIGFMQIFFGCLYCCMVSLMLESTMVVLTEMTGNYVLEAN